MIRHWKPIGVRVAAVGLLVAGAVAGAQLGQGRPAPQAVQAPLSVQADADADDIQLLKARQNAHVAARAWQRQAETTAAVKAASEAKIVAGRAHELELKMKAKRKAALVPYNGPIPSSCQEFTGNRATGCALMLDAGYPIDQFPCLNNLWTKESGWNARATNRGSGAYGIPQACPGSKMGSIAPDWQTNPATQIKWGLGYVRGKYKSPCGAWSHFQSAHSY